MNENAPRSESGSPDCLLGGLSGQRVGTDPRALEQAAVRAICHAARELSGARILSEVVAALSEGLGATVCVVQWDPEAGLLQAPGHSLPAPADLGQRLAALDAGAPLPVLAVEGGAAVPVPDMNTGGLHGLLVVLGGEEVLATANAALSGVAGALATALLMVSRVESSEARYRTLVESIPHGVYECTPEGELRFASAEVTELTGFDGDALAAGAWIELPCEDDRERLAEVRRQAARDGRRLRLEYRVRTAAGEIAWVEDQATVRAENGEQLLVGVLIDKRLEKRMEEELAQQSRLSHIGELAAGVAHEVNNPLSGVLNYAQLGQMLIQDEGKLSEALAGIRAEGERILEITQSLLTLAKPPAETAHPLSAHVLVRAALTLLRRQLRDEFIILSEDVPSELPPLRALGRGLQQVLLNLILNARAALNARYPERDPNKRLELRCVEQGEDHLALEVADTGVGIPPENIERLFEPFFSTRPEGTGLGLSISREIALRHGGRLEVESVLGEGSTFRLVVPVWQ